MSTNTQPARSYWVSAASPALQKLRRGLNHSPAKGDSPLVRVAK
jgi:hypothetical protein